MNLSAPPDEGQSLASIDDAGSFLTLRRQFPILSRRLNGSPLVYLDTAASAQKPMPVLNAMRAAYEGSYANVHRGVHTLGPRGDRRIRGGPRQARPLHQCARCSREIVFVRGATEAINLVAASFGRAELRAGDEIILSEMEHHANIVPWQMLRDRKRPRADASCRSTTTAICRSTVPGPADPTHQAGRDNARLQRAGHDRADPGRSSRQAHAAGAAGSRRRLPGGAAPPGRRAGAGRRLLRLLRAQDVWPYRDRRSVWPAGDAGGDAALPGRRRDDRQRELRGDHFQAASLPLRGRNPGDRRGDRPGRRRSTT